MFEEVEKYKKSSNFNSKVTEIKIDLPFGEWIAGKWWNDLDTKPILCLHGWLDNAGTFDRLIPLLPKEFSYFAIDLPGHGRSSRQADGTPYHVLSYTNTILKLMREFKWEKISLMSHSMGAAISLGFAILFPEKVDLMILFDFNKNLDLTTEQILKSMSDSYLNFILFDERNRLKTESPSFTIEELIEKVFEGSLGNVWKESAPYLLERNIERSKKHPNKFCLTRDPRLKAIDLSPMREDVLFLGTSNLRIPFLSLSSPESLLYAKVPFADRVVDVCKKNNPKFECVEVDSDNHYFHINEPEKISNTIADFLRKNIKMTHKL